MFLNHFLCNLLQAYNNVDLDEIYSSCRKNVKATFKMYLPLL